MHKGNPDVPCAHPFTNMHHNLVGFQSQLHCEYICLNNQAGGATAHQCVTKIYIYIYILAQMHVNKLICNTVPVLHIFLFGLVQLCAYDVFFIICFNTSSSRDRFGLIFFLFSWVGALKSVASYPYTLK